MLADNTHMRRLRRCDEFAAAATAMKQCPEDEYEASHDRESAEYYKLDAAANSCFTIPAIQRSF